MEDTPKVTLRAIEPEDLDELYNIENDQELWNVGNNNMPYSRFALHEYIANITGDIYVDQQLRLMICDEHGHTVGMIDLANFNPQHQRAEVGIVIRKDRRDKGYGLAAIKQLIDYSQRILHIHQLYVMVCMDNIKCIKAFEEAGFRRQAILKEWLYDGEGFKDIILLHFFL